MFYLVLYSVVSVWLHYEEGLYINLNTLSERNCCVCLVYIFYCVRNEVTLTCILKV